MAGLERIAERTGVSIGTVSRVLRDKPIRVAPDTRVKIREVAEELGYRPNLLVRAIQSGKTGMIGVMVPPFDSYWAQILYATIRHFLCSMQRFSRRLSSAFPPLHSVRPSGW